MSAVDQTREAPTTAPAGAVAQDPMPGDLVGRYRIREKLGEGGMGVVLLAEDPELGRLVAIKLLRGVEGSEDPEQQRRLLREAQAMARLKHPNLVTVYDVGTHVVSDDETPDGTGTARVFMAMEYITGLTLGAWVKARPRSWKETVEVFVAAGKGLAAAHESGLIHRDFKPGNVIVGDDGLVRVLDFGLVRQAGEVEPLPEPGQEAAALVDDTLAADLTRTGGVLGTPAYMAPEQHLGIAADARSDQFSFCVALYEALFGERPFRGRDPSSIMIAVLDGHRRPIPSTNGVPEQVRQVLAKGLNREREDRFADMSTLLSRLGGAIADAKPWWQRPVVLGGGALALVASLVAVVVLVRSGPAEPDAVPIFMDMPAPPGEEDAAPQRKGTSNPATANPDGGSSRKARSRKRGATTKSTRPAAVDPNTPLPAVEQLPDAEAQGVPDEGGPAADPGGREETPNGEAEDEAADRAEKTQHEPAEEGASAGAGDPAP